MKPSACLASLALAAMLALPAMAQEPITPQTTMREIRQNPAVQASGLYTDIHTWAVSYTHLTLPTTPEV